MPATLVSSTPKSVYESTGKNFAPKRDLDTLASRRPVNNPNSLTLALRDKYLDYIERDHEVIQEHWDIGQMVANLRKGKLLLLRNPITQQVAFVKRNNRFSDNKTVGGLFQFYSTKLTAEWLSSHPELDPICPSDNDQIEALIEAVKIQQDYYSKRFYDSTYEERESLSAQDYGTWITRYRFDPEVKDIVCELLDFPACRWDISRIAEESSYFLYQSVVGNGKLEYLLNADIPADGEDDDGYASYGLQVINQITYGGGNVVGEGKDRQWGDGRRNKNENVVTEMWLQPEEYCDIELEHNEPTISGETLRKGRSLMEMFPNGLCAVGINGMQTIIQLHSENHKDHIVSGLYHTQSFSGIGKGISDAVDVKKEMDDLHSQTMAYIKAHATPATYFMEGLISEDDARNIGKARKVIPINFKNAPDGVTSINQAIQTVTPQNPANAVFEYTDRLNNYLQMSMQVTDFSNGLPGVDNKTATGARIGDANAEMVLVPQHLNKAMHRKRSAKVIYNLFKRFVDKPKFFASRSLNGITAGKYLTGTEFDNVDIDFEIVANSEVSETPYQQRDNLSQLMQFTGGMAGIIEGSIASPEITGAIATAFGAKLPIPKTDDIARVCRRRIEQAKKLLEVELQNQQMMAAIGLPADNTELPKAIVSQLMPPISPMELYAPQKAEWMAKLLDLDEMQYSPLEFRYVLEEMIKWQLGLAVMGQAQLEQAQNMGQVMAQMPMMLGEQAMNSENQQMQQQFAMAQAEQQAMAQQQQAEQQLQMEGQKAKISEIQAEAAHQRSSADAEQAHVRAKELKSMEQKRAA